MKKKGRDAYLIELRNQKLRERFCYWYGVCKVRLDETLRILSEEEFFISQQRIWTIVKESKGVLSAEVMEEAKRPKIRSVRGVPSQVKVVAEYPYQLFPSSASVQ